MITETELREYINRRLEADKEHLERTKGTQWHEPDFYDGAATALQELWTAFGLDEPGRQDDV